MKYIYNRSTLNNKEVIKDIETRIVTLTNGKKVANFSSPHSFEFEDGTVLDAVSNDEAERLKINFNESSLTGGYKEAKSGDITLNFTLSEEVTIEMGIWDKLHREGLVDVVYCPLPMLKAMERWMDITAILSTPFRAIRMTDRIKKLVSIELQCI